MTYVRLLLVTALLFPHYVGAQLMSSNFLIDSYIIGGVGGTYSTSTNFTGELGPGEVYVYGESVSSSGGSGGGGGKRISLVEQEAPTSSPPKAEAVSPPIFPDPTSSVAQVPKSDSSEIPEAEPATSSERTTRPQEIFAPPSETETENAPVGSVEGPTEGIPWQLYSKWIVIGLLALVLLLIIFVVTRRLSGEDDQ